MPEYVKRIPAEDIKQCTDWLLPVVDSDNIVTAVKQNNNIKRRVIEEKEKRKKIQESDAKKILDDASTHNIKEEIIDEEIDDSTFVHSVSAEQLKKMTDEAEKEGYADGYEKGFNKAKDDGFQQGIEKSKKEGQIDIDEKVARLKCIGDELVNFFDEEKNHLEQQLLEMICQLTKTVVKRELTLNSDSILSVVRDSLALLADRTKRVTLYLHSQDMTLVESTFSESEYDIIIEVDDDLLPGGCRIDNQHTLINSSVNDQLDDVIHRFLHDSEPQSEADIKASREAASALKKNVIDKKIKNNSDVNSDASGEEDIDENSKINTGEKNQPPNDNISHQDENESLSQQKIDTEIEPTSISETQRTSEPESTFSSDIEGKPDAIE